MQPRINIVMETTFSHVKPGYNDYKGEGLRPFFLYRDLGVTAATNGALRVQLVRANEPPAGGTGLHRHEMDFHVVYMMRGWARFMYDGVETRVEAGDCVHQRPGVVHELFDWSPDMEFMEIIGPADFKTIEVDR